MKMCKTITLFILLFTGYFCNNAGVTAGTAPPSHVPSPTSKVKQAPVPAVTATSPASKVKQTTESEATHESNDVSEKHLATQLVAGISITFVLLFIVVIIGIWCARRESKGSSAEITSGPSDEAGVSLKNMSAHENQSEWHFERA